MAPLTVNTALAVQKHVPYFRCLSCLATALGASEPDVRSAAQVLVLRGEFRPVPRLCYACSRTELTLVPEKRE